MSEEPADSPLAVVADSSPLPAAPDISPLAAVSDGSLPAVPGVLEVGDAPPEPPWLGAVLASLDPAASSAELLRERFLALLFVLIHEVGFTVPGQAPPNPAFRFDVRILRGLVSLAPLLRVGSSYQLPLSLHSTGLNCHLVAVFHSGLFIVNLHCPEVETFSLSFNLEEYVSLDPDGEPRFSNLGRLSKSFKEVCVRFRDAVLERAGLPSLHLTRLPVEVLLEICSYLDPLSFVRFSTCCQSFKETLSEDEATWRRLFKAYMCLPTDSVSPGSSWRQLFVDETRRKMTASHPPVPPPHPFHSFNCWYHVPGPQPAFYDYDENLLL